jgi:hypothetical protein
MFAPALAEYQAYHHGENGNRLFLMRHGRDKTPEEACAAGSGRSTRRSI